MKNFLASCQELLFPSYCMDCGRRLPFRQSPLFCHDCLARIRFIQPPRCRCCGYPFPGGADHLCGDCLTRPFAFHLARAAVVYQPPVTSLIGGLKFKGQLAGLYSLAALSKHSPGFRELSKPDLILPVPLHPQRLRKRGYNQALLIARACFPTWRQKIDAETLIRKRNTPPQTNLNGPERRKNISGAFSVIQPHNVENRKILLIDDVFTTGSTVHECARALSRSGANRVEIFTLARTV